MPERISLEHYAEEGQESQVDRDERVIREELRRHKLSEKDLTVLRRHDVRKIEIADQLRRRTMMTVK